MNYDYYDKFYVGIRASEKCVKGDENLAFLTQMTGDASFEKRKKTVDEWCGNNRWSGREADPSVKKIIDNSPTHGFTLDKNVSRWSTSNKLIRVLDPRGWQFEISIANLADLLQYTTIVKGVIQEELVYCKTGGSIAIAARDKTIELNKTTKKVKIEALKPLDIFWYQKSRFIYLGEWALHKLICAANVEHTEVSERRDALLNRVRLHKYTENIKYNTPEIEKNWEELKRKTNFKDGEITDVWQHRRPCINALKPPENCKIYLRLKENGETDFIYNKFDAKTVNLSDEKAVGSIDKYIEMFEKFAIESFYYDYITSNKKTEFIENKMKLWRERDHKDGAIYYSPSPDIICKYYVKKED